MKMDILKSLLKMTGALLIGAAIGLLLAWIGLWVFTDTTFAEFLEKLRSAGFVESMKGGAIGIAAFVVSVIILIPLHEAGHLLCGLLSGYGFVSFRIFNITFVKTQGKLHIKRYSIAGTGGQCLMTPPDLPLEKVPVMLYNAGGVLANLAVLLSAAPLLLIKGHPVLTEVVVIFLLTDLFFLLINGIPMKIGGVGNDAYNMIELRKSLSAKRAMVISLRANALIQQGMTPGNLPAEWFGSERVTDYSNALEVSVPLMEASRLVDRMDYSGALQCFEELYGHKDKIIGLYVREIECELVFLRLMCGNKDDAAALLTPELRKYIGAYRKVMSSKERILCAVSLLADNDREKATGIYNGLLRRENEYLLQGEVKSDLKIMKAMLGL